MALCPQSEFGGGLGVETAQLSVLLFPSLGQSTGCGVSQNNSDPVGKCLLELVWNRGFSGSEVNLCGQMIWSPGLKRGAHSPSKPNEQALSGLQGSQVTAVGFFHSGGI